MEWLGLERLDIKYQVILLGVNRCRMAMAGRTWIGKAMGRVSAHWSGKSLLRLD